MDYNHAVGKEKERQNKSRANLEKILYRSVREERGMPYKKVLIKKASVQYRKIMEETKIKIP